MLELLASLTDPSNLAVTLGVALAGVLSGSAIERKRNGRRGNPGPNADDYRPTSRRGSDSPGLGKVCRQHNDGISANRAAVAALGADMETYSEQVTLIFKKLDDIQEKVTTLVERVGD